MQKAADVIAFQTANTPAEVWARGSFATCVRFRESHDGQDPNAHGNLYGVQDANGHYSWAAGVSRARQNEIAYNLYVRYGVQPWRPYDGC